MTAVLPPIVCRYPFANDEIAAFCDDIERELSRFQRSIPRVSNFQDVVDFGDICGRSGEDRPESPSAAAA